MHAVRFAMMTSLILPLVMSASDAPTKKDAAAAMRDLRTTWLSRVPAPGTFRSADDVVAVAMDWPLGDHIITVLASSSGDASLYTTSTFGIMGGVGHEAVRTAAMDLVRCARRFLPLTAATTSFPYPDKQTLRFYFVTPAGVRVVSFPLRDVDHENSPGRTLYAYAQNLVTELRQLTPETK
jgi:hypothetical protein